MKNFTRFIFSVIVLMIIDPSISEGQWSTLTMQSPRCRLAAASGGDVAAFVAGIGMISWPPDHADVYHVSTGAVTSRNISLGRTDLAGAGTGLKLMFAGGADESILIPFDIVDFYDGATNGWSTTHLSASRSKLAGTSSGNLIFFGGGIDRDNQQKTFKVVDIYDTATTLWSATNMSLERYGLAAASAGGKVMFAGGADFYDVALNTVDIYDVATQTWSIDSLSEARVYCTATSVGNKIYIAGGINGNGIGSKVVDIYDVTTGSWTTDSLSVGRGYVTSATIGDLAFFAGGSDLGFSSCSDDVDIFNTTTQTWSHTQLTTSRTLAAATSIGDLFMIGGGISDGGMPIGSIEIYSLITGMNDLSKNNDQLLLFPNPVSNDVTVKLINTIANGTLEIYDELGQTVYATNLNSNLSEVSVDFTKFNQGVYTVKINDGKNNIIKKFIKI